MTRTKLSKLVAIVFVAVVFVSAAPAQAGGNGWGWSKPINKRMGAFYTSNKNANFQRKSNYKTPSHYNHHRTYVPSVHQHSFGNYHSAYKQHHITKPIQTVQHHRPLVITKSPVKAQVIAPHQPATKSVLNHGFLQQHNHHVPVGQPTLKHPSKPIVNGYWQ
ncbi:hypothetical protein [Roseiconus lacunae]|uniref:hypothetical protein n=1 Tax=Roseiconus lacunae TaxID=2605694 RepID=UPI001E58CB21|nr:hypothetical protein [Roseiconus lacunae]MCD0460464.1 hypothetical protein [Roseiconus lacunae]